MPRRAKVRPDEPGRRKILDAALELFGERGYHATSIADIGRRAAISKSVVFHYFASKARLYEAIVEDHTDQLLESVAAALPADPDAPRVRAGIDAYLRYLAEHRPLWRLLVRDAPADPGLAEVNERLAALRRRAIADLLATPEKRAAAPAHIGLVGTAIRTFAAWWYEHPDVPREAVVDAIMDVARAGARPAAAARGG